MLNDPRSVNSRQSSDQHLEMRRTTSVLVHTRGRTHAPVRRHVRTYVVAGIACTWLQRVCLYQYTRVSFACLRLCCGRCQLTTIIPSPCPLHPLPLHPRGRSQCLFADVQILLFAKHSCQIRRTLHALAEATHTRSHTLAAVARRLMYFYRQSSPGQTHVFLFANMPGD